MLSKFIFLVFSVFTFVSAFANSYWGKCQVESIQGQRFITGAVYNQRGKKVASVLKANNAYTQRLQNFVLSADPVTSRKLSFDSANLRLIKTLSQNCVDKSTAMLDCYPSEGGITNCICDEPADCLVIEAVCTTELEDLGGGIKQCQSY